MFSALFLKSQRGTEFKIEGLNYLPKPNDSQSFWWALELGWVGLKQALADKRLYATK